MIQIKHKITGDVLYSHDGANLRGAYLADADLRDADLRGADLAGADLRGANLADTNLADANLRGANLRGAKLGDLLLIGSLPIIQIGPIGSRSDYLVVFHTDKGIMITTGCFHGTYAEFADKAHEIHGDNRHGRMYAAALAMIDAWATIEAAP